MLTPFSFAYSFFFSPMHAQFLSHCHSRASPCAGSLTLPCTCAECDAMDAVHDLPWQHQHPLSPHSALALQCSQLRLCFHHQRGPLLGLPHGCQLHQPGIAAHPLASWHPSLQLDSPCCRPSLVVHAAESLCIDLCAVSHHVISSMCSG